MRSQKKPLFFLLTSNFPDKVTSPVSKMETGW